MRPPGSPQEAVSSLHIERSGHLEGGRTGHFRESCLIGVIVVTASGPQLLPLGSSPSCALQHVPIRRRVDRLLKKRWRPFS